MMVTMLVLMVVTVRMLVTRKMVRMVRVLCGNQLTNLKGIMLRSVSSLCFWV